MITATTDRVFKPVDSTTPDFEAAELEAKTLVAQLALPEGFSIYPCTARFYSWAEPAAKEWFQLRSPGGGETTLDRAELLALYPLTTSKTETLYSDDNRAEMGDSDNILLAKIVASLAARDGGQNPPRRDDDRNDLLFKWAEHYSLFGP